MALRSKKTNIANTGRSDANGQTTTDPNASRQQASATYSRSSQSTSTRPASTAVSGKGRADGETNFDQQISTSDRVMAESRPPRQRQQPDTDKVQRTTTTSANSTLSDTQSENKATLSAPVWNEASPGTIGASSLTDNSRVGGGLGRAVTRRKSPETEKKRRNAKENEVPTVLQS